MPDDIANGEPDDLDVEDTEETEEEEQDILRYDISAYPSDMTLRVYFDKWNDGQLIVPDFQRKYVWDMVQASKLIESFLIGIPVPGVFLYKQHKTNKLLIIDGQQRIQSIVRFFQESFDDRKFRLRNVREPWKGKSYKELSDSDRYQLQDSILRATVVQQLSPDDYSSIYYIFERLNTGGVKLSPMEIRKCLYAGPLFQKIEELNQHTEWRKLLGRKKLDRRLRDAELVLRVLALAESWQNYEKPMKGFLNSFLVEKRRLAEGELSEYIAVIESAFSKGSSLICNALNEKPFHLRGRINLGLLDCTMAIVLTEYDKIDENLNERFEKMKSDDNFITAVRYNTSDTSVVRERFSLARSYLIGERIS